MVDGGFALSLPPFFKISKTKYMSKKELKKLRVANSDLLKEGARTTEIYYIKGTMEDMMKYWTGTMFKSTRTVNHYRRMKRLMKRNKITAEKAIEIYKP